MVLSLFVSSKKTTQAMRSTILYSWIRCDFVVKHVCSCFVRQCWKWASLLFFFPPSLWAGIMRTRKIWESVALAAVWTVMLNVGMCNEMPLHMCKLKWKRYRDAVPVESTTEPACTRPLGSFLAYTKASPQRTVLLRAASQGKKIAQQ